MLLPKKNKLVIALFGLLMMSQFLIAQTANKGKFYAYWGWNRGTYSTSDIRFKGSNYDFTLSKVVAKDRPTKFGFTPYFNLLKITIPQVDYRIGYFFKENYTVSIGVDHMKYVMQPDQFVTINGQINAGTPFDKTYNNETIKLTENFLKFEHTDGLNYINVAVNRFDNISSFFGLNSKNFQVNLTEGIGVGMLFPRTNTTLLGKARYDEFHISGWGTSVMLGLNLTFLKHFFIQSEFKAGYINMPDIRTTINPADRAAQHFTFLENTLVFGGRFRLFNSKK